MTRGRPCFCFTYSPAYRLPISACNNNTATSTNPPDGGGTMQSIPRRAAVVQPARVRVRELEVRAGARSAALRATEASEQLQEIAANTTNTNNISPTTVEALESLIGSLQRELRTLRKLGDPRLDIEIDNIEALNARAGEYLLEMAERAQKENENSSTTQALDSGEKIGSTASQDPISSSTESADGVMLTDNNDDTTSSDREAASTATGGNVSQRTSPDAKATSSPPAVAEKIAHGVRTSVVRGGSELKRRAESVRSGVGTTVSQFVREDGTIDLKVLREILSGRLDSAGTIWSRLNGRAEEELERRTEGKGVYNNTSNFVPINTEEEQFRLREVISDLERELMTESKKREANLRKEDQLGKLIRAKEIRAMDDNVNAIRRTLAVRVLQLEMEKIYVALTEEFERGFISMGENEGTINNINGNNSATLVIAEFSELDSKLMDLSDYIDQKEPLLVADDSLGTLANDIQYLKTRLGLDATLYTSSTLDWLQVRQIFLVSVKKTKTGLEFYARGFRLFTGDLVYAGKLIKRVVWGYVPTPREVRTIRRTGRDLLTLIPFTIILIAPLTPIGHVLVFSFIQRNWPEFFPSTFSERRQSLMKRYENYARANREEEIYEYKEGAPNNNGEGGESNTSKSTSKRRRSGIIGRVVLAWKWMIDAEGTRSNNNNKKERGSGASGRGDKLQKISTATATINNTTATNANTTTTTTGRGGTKKYFDDDNMKSENRKETDLTNNNDNINNTRLGANANVTDTNTTTIGEGKGVERKADIIMDGNSGNSFGQGDTTNNSNSIGDGGGRKKIIGKGETKSLGIDDLHLAD